MECNFFSISGEVESILNVLTLLGSQGDEGVLVVIYVGVDGDSADFI